MRKRLILLAALCLGGCLSKSGGDLDASATSQTGRTAKEKAQEESGKPREVCENTLIGGEAKRVCY